MCKYEASDLSQSVILDLAGILQYRIEALFLLIK